MNELRSLFTRQLRRLLVCGALGCLVSLPVAAQSPLQMPTRLDRFHVFANGNIVRNQYTSAFEAEGIRLAQNARVYGTATTGGVSLSKQLAINTRNGIVVAEARQKISARQIAKGIGLVAGGPLGIALLGTAVMADFLDDAGLAYEDGQFMAPAPSYCPSAPCYEWQNLNTSQTGPWVRTPQEAAQFAIGKFVNGCGTVTSVAGIGLNTGGHPNYYANYICAGSPTPRGPYGIASRTRSPDAQPVYVPATPQQVEDQLTAANPSPAVLRELAETGQHAPSPDPGDPAQITNPQQSQEKTTTKTNPDGSTETTVCRTTGTVVGNDLKLQEACTITARDPQGNITGTTTTTTDDSDPEPAQEEQSLFCELFPNVLACAEFGEPEGDEIPRDERNVDYQAENLFGSGTCPADTTVVVRGQTVTVGQWSMWCGYVVDYVRPMVLLLAAFTALMIVARGMPE